MLLENNDLTGAKEVLTQAASIKVKSDEDKFNVAKLHFYQKNNDDALPELEESISAGFDEANYYIGEIYRMKKDDAKAIYYYGKYIKSGKVRAADAYNQIAVCLIHTEDYKEAVEYLKKGIAYKDAGTLQILKKNEIIAYETMGDFKTAKKQLGEYQKEYPKDKDAGREMKFVETRLIQ